MWFSDRSVKTTENSSIPSGSTVFKSAISLSPLRAKCVCAHALCKQIPTPQQCGRIGHFSTKLNIELFGIACPAGGQDRCFQLGRNAGAKRIPRLFKGLKCVSVHYFGPHIAVIAR